jgi:hypothetical protein
MNQGRRVRDLPRLEREKLRARTNDLAAKGYAPATIARKLDVASLDVRRFMAEAARDRAEREAADR